MEKKNFNLTVATVTFALGAFFVLANTEDITANVIGASGPGATATALAGIILIIASAGFFVFVINHGDTHLERLIRETRDHETIEVDKEVSEHDAKLRYDHKHDPEYKK
jgi:hypothetical protein